MWIIFLQLFKTTGESVLVEVIFWSIMFLLSCWLKLFKSRKCTPQGWLLFRGKVLLDLIGILLDWWVIIPKLRTSPHTLSISHASTTLSQSQSVIVNAVHGMCFTTRLSWHNVVMGPYISSTVAKNKPIGYWTINTKIVQIENKIKLTWQSLVACSSILNAVPHCILLCKGIFTGLERPQWICVLWKYSMCCPDAWI